MWKAELMKYKEYTFLLNQSGSGYLSLVLEVQGRAGPGAGAGRESLSLGQNHMDLTQSLWQNSHQCPVISPENEVVWGLGNQDLSLIWALIAMGKSSWFTPNWNSLTPSKQGRLQWVALVGLFCLQLFNLFHYFVVYWCSEKFWEQRSIGALGWTCSVHKTELLDGSGCAESKI